MARRSTSNELTRIGEHPTVKRMRKQLAPPTRAQLEFIERAIAISEAPDAAERAYMARQLVLCTLPHSDPGNVPIWSRRTGNFTLSVQPGYARNASTEQQDCIGYPHGTIPRLLLFWIITEAVRTQQRRLYLSNSLAEFMRKVGLDPSRGGKRSDHRRLKNQMHRLFRAKISFEEHDPRKARWMNMDVAPRGELWWHPHDAAQGALYESWIDLGEDFFEAIRAMPVPVDTRALKALKGSALALDLYALVCFRAFAIVKHHLPAQTVTWAQLQTQLGTDYADVGNFRRKAKAALAKIKTLYPGLTIGTAKGGFTIHATRLAVPQKPVPKSL